VDEEHSVLSLNILMIGPPGVGKGTQAERFARTRGIPKISTGDILRDAVQAGTDLGRRAKAIMDRGELVGDDVMIGIVRDRLDQDDARSGFVLDGFPRTVAQASALDEIMIGRDPLIVIEIVAPEAELVRRLSSRLICEGCGANASVGDSGISLCARCGGRLVQRADDNDAVVRERLKVYQRQSAPMVEYYKARPTFRSVDGAQPPDRVAADLASAIDAAGAVAARGSDVPNTLGEGERGGMQP
jgi:adenylate kinase